MSEHSKDRDRARSAGDEFKEARSAPDTTAAESDERSASGTPGAGEPDLSQTSGPAEPGSERMGDDGTQAEQIERLERERDEYLENLKRERASFLNYKRWVERERKGWETGSVCRFVEQFLPFIDDLDRALGAAEEATDVQALREGFEMICSRFRDVLSAAGVEEIPSDGEPFDPRVHEAILQVEDPDQPSGTVLETTHRGFRLNDRLIRAAKVVVSKGPQSARDATPSDSEEAREPDPDGGDAGPENDRGGH